MLMYSPTVPARKVPPILGCGLAAAAGAGVLTAGLGALVGAAAAAGAVVAAGAAGLAVGAAVGAALGTAGPHAASSGKPRPTPAIRSRNVRRLVGGAGAGRSSCRMIRSPSGLGWVVGAADTAPARPSGAVSPPPRCL